jgi:hypothetical protein
MESYNEAKGATDKLKFIEEEFGIVEEPDTTLTRLLDGLRLSEETLHKLMKQPPPD